MLTNTRDETLGSLLAGAAEEVGSRTFLVEEGHAISFSEMKRRADAVSSALLSRGYVPGERVAIAGTNQSAWVEALLGVTQVGMVLVTLNVRYRREELTYMLERSGASAVITPSSHQGFDLAGLYRDLRQELHSLRDVFFLDEVPGEASFAELETGGNADSADAMAAVTAEAPAIILFTSGTTGRPKGATITHRSIIASGRAQAEHFGMLPDDRMCGHMPFNHVGGVTCTLVASLVARSSVALLENFTPRRAIELIAHGGLTIFSGVPTMFVLMLADPSFPDLDTSAIRLLVAGGANVEPSLLAKMRNAFPRARICNLYGLSETSGACIISPLDDSDEEVASTLGKAIGKFELRAVGPSGDPVEPGSDGELLVKGDCVVQGYWEDPAATAEAINAQGWLSTGDIVSLSPDGHVSLRGRRKEMFIQGGYNVYPVEVENVLTSHPQVAMAAGIGVPDPVLGEVGRYYIVPQGDVAPSPDELNAYCMERLADYKVPREYVFAKALPLTPVGKIQKAVLSQAVSGEVFRPRR